MFFLIEIKLLNFEVVIIIIDKVLKGLKVFIMFKEEERKGYCIIKGKDGDKEIER